VFLGARFPNALLTIFPPSMTGFFFSSPFGELEVPWGGHSFFVPQVFLLLQIAGGQAFAFSASMVPFFFHD